MTIEQYWQEIWGWGFGLGCLSIMWKTTDSTPTTTSMAIKKEGKKKTLNNNVQKKEQ